MRIFVSVKTITVTTTPIMQKQIFFLLGLFLTIALHCSAQKYSSKPVGSHRDLYRHSGSSKDTKEKRPGLSKKKDTRPGFNRSARLNSKGNGKGKGKEDKLSVRDKSRRGHHNTYHDNYSTGGGYQKSSPDYKSTGLKHHV